MYPFNRFGKDLFDLTESSFLLINKFIYMKNLFYFECYQRKKVYVVDFIVTMIGHCGPGNRLWSGNRLHSREINI